MGYGGTEALHFHLGSIVLTACRWGLCSLFSCFYARESGDFLIFSFPAPKYRSPARIKN